MLFASDHAPSFTEPAQITYIVRVTSYSVDECTTAVITCEARGELPMNISWVRESDHTVLDNSTNSRVTVVEELVIDDGFPSIKLDLTIRQVDKEDESNYTCVAVNEFGSDSDIYELKGK